MAAQDKSSPDWQDAPLSTADRRRSERKVMQAVARLSASSRERHLQGRTVTLVDLSLHGAGFQSPAPLTVGSLYNLQITSDWLNLSSRVRVVSCRQREDQSWDVGAEFAHQSGFGWSGHSATVAVGFAGVDQENSGSLRSSYVCARRFCSGVRDHSPRTAALSRASRPLVCRSVSAARARGRW